MTASDSTSNSDEFFSEIMKSEVTLVRCRGCNTDQPVNNAYLRYLTNGISSCRHCRELSR